MLDTELVVYIIISRSQVKRAQKHPDGYILSPNRSSIHNLKLRNRLILVGGVLASSDDFSSNYRNFHILDANSYEQEVDLTQNALIEVVTVFVVLKFDVQAFLYSYFHLDAGILLCLVCRDKHRKLLLTHCITCESLRDHRAQEITQTTVLACIGLELLLDAIKGEGNGSALGNSSCGL